MFGRLIFIVQRKCASFSATPVRTGVAEKLAHFRCTIKINRPNIGGKTLVTPGALDHQVMGMHMSACSNGLGSLPDKLSIFSDRVGGGNIVERDLVARANLFRDGQ